MADLAKTKEEVNKMLAKMPISMQSQRLKKQKQDLEDKIMEIDRAMDLFKRKTVYVQV